MSADLKPITVYAHYGSTPNPPKVLILLELLGLPYTVVDKQMRGDESDPNHIKHPNFTSINPNGRIPAIVDPNNNDFAVWESAAILQYLAEKYDPSGKYYGKDIEERTLVNIWLAFQISGQGPMQGQYFWFNFPQLHEAKWGKPASDDVKERYKLEVARIYTVFEGQLERQKAKGSEWVALDRLTIADIAWFVWARLSPGAGIDLEKFPLMKGWLGRLEALDAVKKTYVELAERA
ncbi:Glutathione-S-transferase [Dactylella cylindrospora]|nr:Glutathione-S-transferase [Dactylella cylindrospora]